MGVGVESQQSLEARVRKANRHKGAKARAEVPGHQAIPRGAKARARARAEERAHHLCLRWPKCLVALRPDNFITSLVSGHMALQRTLLTRWKVSSTKGHPHRKTTTYLRQIVLNGARRHSVCSVQTPELPPNRRPTS